MKNKSTAKYYIYRNLHTGGFSIKYKGKVIERIKDQFIATNVTFKVNELSRQRVIKEGRKNVHAYVVTENYIRINKSSLYKEQIIYNPYKSNKFKCSHSGKEINNANEILFKDGRCYLITK